MYFFVSMSMNIYTSVATSLFCSFTAAISGEGAGEERGWQLLSDFATASTSTITVNLLTIPLCCIVAREYTINLLNIHPESCPDVWLSCQ